MPEGDNEVILVVNDDDYYFKDNLEEAIKKVYYYDGNKSNIGIVVVGVKYIDDVNGNNLIYCSDKIINQYITELNRRYSKVILNINGKNYAEEEGFYISVNNNVPKGYAYVSEDISYACKDYECKNKSLGINISNLYYSDNINLKISKVYTPKNVKSLLGINDAEYINIFINREDYNKLFNRESYQASVIVNHVDNVQDVSNELEELGYKTLQIRHTLV